MRSKEEIDKEIEKGKRWIEKYPYSAFGDDNTEQYRLFLKIVEFARKGWTRDQLEDFADSQDNENLRMFAFGVIDWLEGYEEEIYPEEEVSE